MCNDRTSSSAVFLSSATLRKGTHTHTHTHTYTHIHKRTYVHTHARTHTIHTHTHTHTHTHLHPLHTPIRMCECIQSQGGTFKIIGSVTSSSPCTSTVRCTLVRFANALCYNKIMFLMNISSVRERVSVLCLVQTATAHISFILLVTYLMNCNSVIQTKTIPCHTW